MWSSNVAQFCGAVFSSVPYLMGIRAWSRRTTGRRLGFRLMLLAVLYYVVWYRAEESSLQQQGLPFQGTNSDGEEDPWKLPLLARKDLQDTVTDDVLLSEKPQAKADHGSELVPATAIAATPPPEVELADHLKPPSMRVYKSKHPKAKKRNLADPLQAPFGLHQNIYEPPCPVHPRLELPKLPYGYIPEQMRAEAKVVCQGNGANSLIRLYPGHILEMHNVVLDFGKRRLDGGGYAEYEDGFVLVDCQDVNDQQAEYRLEKVSRSVQHVPHLDRVPGKNRWERVQTPTIVAARDDCGNVWHAMADFLKVFTSGYVAKAAPQDSTVLVLDDRLMITESPDDVVLCPYHGALDALGRRGVLRGVDYAGKRVWFDRLVLPAEDNTHGVLNLIWNMYPCDTNRVLSRYVNNLFDYFGHGPLETMLLERQMLLSGDQPSGKGEERKELLELANIQITFSSRRKKPFAPAGAKIGRVIQNEEELVEALESEIPGVTVVAQEFYEMEFEAQLQLFRQTDILVGMHGAGLANLVYLPLDGAVIELIPFTWSAQEYSNLAGITGRAYYTWRNTHKQNHVEPDCRELAQKETAESPGVCRTGTSETIADIPEIIEIVRKAVDSLRASRQARVSA